MAFGGILQPVKEPGIGERLARASQTLVPQFTQQLASQAANRTENESLQRMGMDLSGIQNPELRKIALQEGLRGNRLSQQQLQKTKEKEQEEKGFKDSLDWLEENIDATGPLAKITQLAGIPGTPSYQKRAEFDAQGFWVTDKAFTHFNKGQISKEKLRVIQEDLAPKADLTRRTNKARIAAIRRLSGLPSDVPAKVFDKQLEIEKKALGKIEKSAPMDKKADRPPLSSFYE